MSTDNSGEERGICAKFSQKSRLYYMVAYARYIKESANMLQIHPYQPIYIAYNRILSHNRLSNSKTCQTHEIILTKPMFLSQKDSKPHWKRSRIEEKRLAYGRGGQ